MELTDQQRKLAKQRQKAARSDKRFYESRCYNNNKDLQSMLINEQQLIIDYYKELLKQKNDNTK